jgi:hypothetical protein
MHRLISFTIAATAFSLPCLSHGQVVITEIMYNPQSVNIFNDVDWVEIYNDSDAPVDLENWRLFDQEFLLSGGAGTEEGEAAAPEPFSKDAFSGGTNPNSSILAPGEVAVIINGKDAESAFKFRERWALPLSVKVIAPDWRGRFDMDANPIGTYFPDTNTISGDADPDWLALSRDDGTIVDVVDYRNSNAGNFAYRFWPDAGSASAPKGGSIYLRTDILLGDNPTGDNDSGSSWLLSVAGAAGAYRMDGSGSFIYSSNDVGTPGFIDGITDVVIPEPAAMSLLVGLSALFGWRRRR